MFPTTLSIETNAQKLSGAAVLPLWWQSVKSKRKWRRKAVRPDQDPFEEPFDDRPQPPEIEDQYFDSLTPCDEERGHIYFGNLHNCSARTEITNSSLPKRVPEGKPKQASELTSLQISSSPVNFPTPAPDKPLNFLDARSERALRFHYDRMNWSSDGGLKLGFATIDTSQSER